MDNPVYQIDEIVNLQYPLFLLVACVQPNMKELKSVPNDFAAIYNQNQSVKHKSIFGTELFFVYI